MKLKTKIACLLLCLGTIMLWAEEDKSIIDDFSKLKYKNNDSTSEVIEHQGKSSMKISFGHKNAWPNASVLGNWNLSKNMYIKADITNLSDEAVLLGCRVDNKGATGSKNNSAGKITVGAGATETITVFFNRKSRFDFEEMLPGMAYFPHGVRSGATLDPSKIVGIQFFGFRPSRDYVVVVNNIRSGGVFDKAEFDTLPEPFMPFVDEFGQYKHHEWLNKVKSQADLEKLRELEAKELANSATPPDFNQYGGWEKGPTLEATGHFRTEFYQEKWWLVDPTGKLFWSFGPTCVRMEGGETVVESRDGWFEKLPPESGDALSVFYSKKTPSRKSYKDQTLKTFLFGNANLFRKYGADWVNISTDITNRRLKSWGMNSLGCWAIGKVIDSPQMPYANWIFYTTPKIQSWGTTTKPFPDFFAPSFEENLKRRATNYAGKRKNDPYCIGFFIDNELSWGARSTLGRSVLKAPKNQAAKIALVKMLQEKYKTIEELNKVWKSKYSDWSVFDDKLTPGVGADDDLADYCRLTAEKYYSTCRKIMDEVAPNKLYLGSRLAEVNEIVAEVAAKYCDVVSFNLYRNSVADWRPPAANFNKPVIIGEFHFGATDAGVLGAGLVRVANQEARAKALEDYITGALQNPFLVGAHWFQYRDEPTSGRPLDSENFQIGLVDICDTPYKQTIDAVRKVGYDMYKTRSGK